MTNTDTQHTDTPPPIGRPADVSDDAIIEAGNALAAAGSRITGYALRRKLGNKGEAKRLMRVWKAHEQSHQVLDAEPVQELPVEVDEALTQVTTALVDQIQALARKLNSTAVQTAERRIAEALATARDTQEQAEAELADAAATVDELEASVARLERETADQGEQLAAAARKAQDDARRLTQLERDLAVLREKLEHEEDQRERAETTLQQRSEQLADLQQDKNELKGERDQLRLHVTQLQDERDNLAATKGELTTQLATLTEREAGWVQRIEQANADRDSARQAAETAQTEAIAERTKAEQLQTQLTDFMTRFDTKPAPARKTPAKKKT